MAASFLLDRFTEAAARAPDLAAVVCGDRRLDRRALADLAVRLGRGLRAKMTSGAPPRVALVLPKNCESIALIIACLQSRVTFVPVSLGWPLERQERILGLAAPQLIVCEPAQVATFARLAPAVCTLDQLLAETSDRVISDNDTAYIIFTSGSTGDPKGVQISYAGLDVFAANMERIVKLRDDGEQLVCIAELTFDMSVIDYTFMLLGKGTLHLLDSRVNSLALAKYVAEHGLTYVLSAPTTFALLCSYASWFDAKKLASLRTILVGGSAFHTKTAGSLAALTPAATIYNLYGPTEVTVCCAGCVVQADDRKAAATIHIGGAFPGNLFLFDDGESIADSPRNEAELLIAGSQLMQGYVGQGASLETIQWQGQPVLVYRTGDIFEMRNGKLFFVTRKGGFIKSRGYRLSPHEIEDACLSHPAIAECAVVGMPDLTAENVLVLFYSTRSPLEVGDLTAHLQAKLASYSIPEAFVSLDELPKSSSGKVDYGALRTLAGARK